MEGWRDGGMEGGMEGLGDWGIEGLREGGKRLKSHLLASNGLCPNAKIRSHMRSLRWGKSEVEDWIGKPCAQTM